MSRYVKSIADFVSGDIYMLILTVNANPVNQQKTHLEAWAKEAVLQAYHLHNHTKRSLKK